MVVSSANATFGANAIVLVQFWVSISRSSPQ
jgi:hypothetical protein